MADLEEKRLLLVRVPRVDTKRIRDAVFSAVAVAFGIASLGYPLGHDQSIHFVVAREWLLHGALPYRDVFDHKPPGIYLLHMLSMELFGAHTWAIRPLELATVIVLGWTVAALSVRRDRSATGRFGIAALVTSFLYYGYFTFLSTAQPELWATAFGLGAIALARRGRDTGATALAAGALSGLALLMKPTIAPFVGCAFVMLLARTRQRAVFGACFAATLVAPTLLVVAYFARASALGSMYDVLVVGNEAYLRNVRAINDVNGFVHCNGELFGWFHPISTVLLVGTLARVVVSRLQNDQRTLRRWGFAVALVGAGWLSVIAQLKFHIYHYVPIIPGAALLLLHAIDDATAWARRPAARLALVAVAALFVVAIYPLSGRRARTWWAVSSAEARRVAGAGPQSAVDATFMTAGGRAYVYTESREVGAWLRDHARPDDGVAVRGCHPEIYAIAELSPVSRFFWTTAYTHAMWSYRGAEWEAEDHRALDRTQPRFVVMDAVADRPESPSYFQDRGYRVATAIGPFLVLERHDPVARARATQPAPPPN